MISNSAYGARSGMITSFPLLPARPHDVQFLEELVEDFVGTVPVDKGFIGASCVSPGG